MKKELNIQEWKEIGDNVKDIRKNLNDLFTILSNRLSKTEYSHKYDSVDKSFSKLQSHLDDIVCAKFTDVSDEEVTNIFYD